MVVVMVVVGWLLLCRHRKVASSSSNTYTLPAAPTVQQLVVPRWTDLGLPKPRDQPPRERRQRTSEQRREACLGAVLCVALGGRPPFWIGMEMEACRRVVPVPGTSKWRTKKKRKRSQPFTTTFATTTARPTGEGLVFVCSGG
uniref:Putative secreted protein n=1 Tax=Anopheles darlingi TaxID=43151 RepID=A0A2M4D063_ANODA